MALVLIICYTINTPALVKSQVKNKNENSQAVQALYFGKGWEDGWRHQPISIPDWSPVDLWHTL